MGGFSYRADIDGVRAVAVMGVILAHAGLGAPGGFLGVDIFFVISGYLITTILLRDLEAGRYTLRGFYERRARRILPALVLVIACCVPFAVWLLLPDFLENFGQSVFATLFFSNNILLAATSGYWEIESAFKPLLHTWSLGVEEQFYIVFPLVLAFLWRFGRRAQIVTLAVAALVSFGLAEHGWRTYPEASFYLPTSRAWELLAGCLIAYVPRKPRGSDQAVTLACLAALILPLVLFDEHTPSPSVYSSIPVLATAGLILFNRPETLAYRLLALPPLVFIGLISYSAYLWHQPVFAFVRIASFEPPGQATMVALTVATLALAALSWWFVERPFRDRAAMPLRRFVPLVGSGTALLAAGALVLHFSHGFPRWTYPNIDGGGDVYIAYNERIRQYSAESFPDNGRPNVLLIGTSYGRDIGNVMIEAGAIEGKNLVYFARLHDCGEDGTDHEVERRLSRQASLVVVALEEYEPACVRAAAQRVAGNTDAPVVYFGTKNWGRNINPFGRVPLEERASAYAAMPPEVVRGNEAARAMLGGSFIDMARLLGDGRRLRFYDDRGNPLAPDRWHLTRYGARFVARKLDADRPSGWRLIAG